ncbi:hypothetical protein M407DRAFT_245922, partial [Tulasnella calospora MUT 4182]
MIPSIELSETTNLSAWTVTRILASASRPLWLQKQKQTKSDHLLSLIEPVAG